MGCYEEEAVVGEEHDGKVVMGVWIWWRFVCAVWFWSEMDERLGLRLRKVGAYGNIIVDAWVCRMSLTDGLVVFVCSMVGFARGYSLEILCFRPFNLKKLLQCLCANFHIYFLGAILDTGGYSS